MAAPICRLQPPPPVFDSVAPNLPAIPLVTLNIEGWNIPPPVAAQLQAMAQTINSLRNVIMLIGGRAPPPNNLQLTPLPLGGSGGVTVGSGGGGGSASGSPSQRSNNPTKPPQNQQPKKQNKGMGSFVEVGRSVTEKKVENPDDPEQFVMVQEITSVTFVNPTTGETISFRQ